jgi:hypothetical protein
MSAASVQRESVVVVSPEGPRSTVLKRDSLGLSAVFCCIATAAAPMTAILFNVPVIVSGADWAVPAAFIVALAMLLVFTVGYVEMARRVTRHRDRAGSRSAAQAPAGCGTGARPKHGERR